MQGITGILDIKIKEHRQTCLATTKTCVAAALRGCSGFRQWTFCASKLTKILLPIINKLEVLLHRDAVKILAEEFQKDYGLGREQKIRLLSKFFQSSQDFQSKCHDSRSPANHLISVTKKEAKNEAGCYQNCIATHFNRSARTSICNLVNLNITQSHFKLLLPFRNGSRQMDI